MELPVICEPQQLHRWQRPLVPAAVRDVHTAATLICKASEPQRCLVFGLRGNKYLSGKTNTRLNR